jgi:hypothetical protein
LDTAAGLPGGSQSSQAAFGTAWIQLEEASMFLLSRVQFILFVLFCALLWSTLLFPNQVFCATVDLTWDKPADTSSIAGYKIYTAYSGNSFPDEATKVIADSNETTCSIDGLTEGKTYGFAATSFDAEDNESTYSNTVYYTISESTTSIDADGDGLTDAEEEQYGLDPNNPDTNGNGIPDKDVVHLWGNAWDGDIDGDGTMNLFDLDADGDGVCDATELLHGKDPSDPSDNPSGLPPMVFGEVPVGQEWTTVELNKTFQYPVVVVGPLSLNDQEPAVVRTQNIHSQGFDIRLQEYEYQDGPHAQEQVSFLVMEMGSYYLPDGTRIEASYFDTQAMYSDFDTIPFNSPFQTQPVVTASIATFNGQRPVTGRIHNLSTQGFDYSLQEEEDSALDHEQESVAYIAWEPSNGEIDGTQFEVEFAKNITHEKKAISFQKPFTASPSILSSMQSCLEGDTANLRIAEQKNDELTVQVHEEKSLDTEHSHIDEDIGYIALAQNTNTLAVNFQPADAEVPEGYEVDSGEALDSSTKYGWVTVPGVPRDRNQWISFDQAYDTMIHVSPSSVWEAKLPNGTYAVTVCMGDPSWPNGMQNVQVENLSLIEYESLSPDQRWIEETMTVEVYDGRLTVSFAGSDNPARLCWIKISSTKQ